jgi:fructose-bisphosphate aldolase, class II
VPAVTPEIYREMLARAKAGGFAYPAVSVTSSQTLNAALRGFAEAGSDGIVRISPGAARYLSGSAVDEMVTGAVAFAEYAQVVAGRCPVHVALHTDHCPPGVLDGFLRPLIALSRERVDRGHPPLFASHMWDGSALPLAENLAIAAELLERCAAAQIVLELEIGVVGGEEEDIAGAMGDRLYSTPEDALRVAEVLGTGDRGAYLLAATFGNVHGLYKPGSVELRPQVLRDIQDAVGATVGAQRPFLFVFHGGSGSSPDAIRASLSYGVVKMNIDTDTQYAFTRAVADHAFTNYAGVLKVDGGLGDKKAYDPRAYGRRAEAAMAARVVEACEDVRSAGTTLAG